MFVRRRFNLFQMQFFFSRWTWLIFLCLWLIFFCTFYTLHAFVRTKCEQWCECFWTITDRSFADISESRCCFTAFVSAIFSKCCSLLNANFYAIIRTAVAAVVTVNYKVKLLFRSFHFSAWICLFLFSLSVLRHNSKTLNDDVNKVKISSCVGECKQNSMHHV